MKNLRTILILLAIVILVTFVSLYLAKLEYPLEFTPYYFGKGAMTKGFTYLVIAICYLFVFKLLNEKDRGIKKQVLLALAISLVFTLHIIIFNNFLNYYRDLHFFNIKVHEYIPFTSYILNDLKFTYGISKFRYPLVLLFMFGIQMLMNLVQNRTRR